MRKFIISALIFVLVFSIAAPGFTAAAEDDFDAKTPVTIDGVKYENVALEKSYERTGDVYDGKWTDTGTDGKPLGKMTDGVVAANGNDEAIGCYKGGETSVTIDLGQAYAIKQVTTDLYGFAEWGIPDPSVAEVTVSVSSDGKSFAKIGDAEKSDEIPKEGWKLRLFTLTLDQTVAARYVRVTYKIQGTFCWTSEVAVFGSEDLSGSSQPPETSSESSQPADSSAASSQPAAQSKASTSSTASAKESSAPADSEEQAEESLTWLYILIGVVVVVVAVGIAVVVANKKKKE